VSNINTKTLFVLLLTFVLLTASLAAAQVEVSDKSQLTIPIDYSSMQDDDFVEISQDISLKTNETTAETVSISITGLSSNYENFKIDGTSATSSISVTVNPGETKTIQITGEVPAGLDEGNITFGQLKIGSQVENLVANVEPMLELKKIYVFTNGATKKALDDDESSPDLMPGDEVELKFVLKNLFDEDYNDGNMEGTITLELDNSDYGDDIDEEIDFNIDAGEEFDEDNDAPSFKFTIPTDAEEDEYDLEITITDIKDDGNGEYKDIKWTISLVIKKEDDDVRVKQLTVNPTEVSCNRKIIIDSEVRNLGSDDQDHAALILSSSELGLYQKYDFALDSGSSSSSYTNKEYTFEIPATITPGIYTIIGKSYYNYNTLSNSLDAQVVVKSCSTTTTGTATSTAKTNTSSTTGTTTTKNNSSTTSTSTTTGTTTTTQNTNANNPAQNTQTASSTATQIASSIVAESIEPEGFSSDDYLLGAMVVGIILVAAMIVLLTLILLK
jgi:hypothetical protein